MALDKHSNHVSDEDGFRDQEERDLRDGWPYADQPGASSISPENRPYGSTPGNFDRDSNQGYQITGVNEAGMENSPIPQILSRTRGKELADEIENRIYERLDRSQNGDFSNVTVSVEDHTVTLTGVVDTTQERHTAVMVALSTAGVRHVLNKIETLGVDTHQPDDE
ncbi:BON domain-containing protein [Allorhizobium sp. BGMRC 0089]|uniref:BON domain-containing protein n=1 Tax=Allorhizobium sonneratiae TaxID=2934936 RepID=UPI00203447E2|nr:BON domain-containing protein [Allorhizobium sonneratiae]MCM2292878.1 BON domain-containing protein [Allorhizobium sonneratiae]